MRFICCSFSSLKQQPINIFNILETLVRAPKEKVKECPWQFCLYEQNIANNLNAH